MLTVGISDECGGGNSGSRPLPSATVSCAVVPQTARPNIIADSISVFARIKHSGREISISVHRCARADPPYAAGIGVGNEQQALAQMSGDGGAGDDPEIVLPIRAVRRGDRHLFTAVLLRPQFAGGLDRAMPVGDRPKRCNAGCDIGVADVGKLILCPTLPFGSAGRRLMLLAQRSEEHTSELQSLMRISYAVFCLKKK